MTFCPFAVQKPISNHSWPGTLAAKKLIVLHITQGPTASSAWWSCYNSVHPNRTSFHFVIDVDGTIWQIVPLEDIAWHASQVNSTSIAIEHAAICGKQPPTPAQYTSSAKLVAWLCITLNIPCDADHILPHSIASPKDAHPLCCNGTEQLPGLNSNQVIAAAKLLLNAPDAPTSL
jgi:N-acetyl-anhydromuramyl-L-alanine amidase AmpD